MKLRTLFAAAALVLHGGVRAATEPVAPTFFGMHFHNTAWVNTKVPRTVVPPVPIGSWRIWDTRNRWADIEPARGKWRFDTLDKVVEQAVQRGMEPLMVLGSTPAWASARPQERCPYGHGCSAEPFDLADWENYVRTLSTRYKGKVRVWELWNEPKFSDVPQNFASSFFSGSTATMVKMAEIAQRVLRQVDPSNRLLTPGFTGAIGQLDHYLAAGGAKYADGIAVHFYVARPEAILPRLKEVRAAMALNGVERLPLWNTEQNFQILRDGVVPPGPAGYGVRDPATLAAYVQRSLILQASYGVERVYWHSWEITFAEPGGAPNDAGRAYLTVARWLTGSVVGSCEPQGASRVIVCPLQQGGQKAWVAWRAEGAGTFTPPVDWGVRGIEASDGTPAGVDAASVPVDIAPVLLKTTRDGSWGSAALR